MGRPLTECESLFVNTMRQQARIRAEIMWLEIKIGHSCETATPKRMATVERLGSLQTLISEVRRTKSRSSEGSPMPKEPRGQNCKADVIGNADSATVVAEQMLNTIARS